MAGKPMNLALGSKTLVLVLLFAVGFSAHAADEDWRFDDVEHVVAVSDIRAMPALSTPEACGLAAI